MVATEPRSPPAFYSTVPVQVLIKNTYSTDIPSVLKPLTFSKKSCWSDSEKIILSGIRTVRVGNGLFFSLGFLLGLDWRSYF